MLRRFLTILAAFFALLAAPAGADPTDISAAARGVVRVVLVQDNGDEVAYVGHGTGFAIAPNLIVTNAHVVAPLRQDDTMIVGVVPSEGSSGSTARLRAYSPRNDLALLELTGKTRLPALSVFPGTVEDGADVYAIGYPGNVDMAQGLSMSDLVEPQAAVKTRGYISAGRSSRQFETLLHTAPIGSGNSGGPLLDHCGRVIGVNSFGTLQNGADSEFYFAVTVRELAAFLREAGVTAPTSAMPCRSIAELDREEGERVAQDRLRSEAQARQQSAAETRARGGALRKAELEVLAERENGMAVAALLLALALAAGGVATVMETRNRRRDARIAGGVGVAVLAAAAIAWFARPPLASIEERAAAQMSAAQTDQPPVDTESPDSAPLVCVFDPQRSRATVSQAADVALDWTADGCVNGRTQYGLADGRWSRILVPNSEATVSVNSFDPATRIYKVERFLLPLATMERARAARAIYSAPQCGAGDVAARQLGADQTTVAALLPQSPNERLLYTCTTR